MDQSGKYFLSGIVGAVIGILLVIGGQNITSPTEKAIVTQDSIKKIMKVYNPLIRDGILIEDPNNSGLYIPVSDYLKRFDNKYERNLEKSKIELLISQNIWP
jgi:hypothetical protein